MALVPFEPVFQQARNLPACGTRSLDFIKKPIDEVRSHYAYIILHVYVLPFEDVITLSALLNLIFNDGTAAWFDPHSRSVVQKPRKLR